MEISIALWVWLVLTAVSTGSFLGVVISRLPNHEPILLGRSECPHCHTRLGPLDLIPVGSFLWRRGRCGYCGTRIDPFHLWVELVALAIVLLAVWRATSPGNFVELCVLGFILMTLAWIDAEHLWLPDIITLPGILIGLGMCWWISPAALGDHAAGAAIGFLSLAAIRVGYRWLRGREGLGSGDAKLLALAGAWTGWQDLAAIMLGAAVLGIGLILPGRLRGGSIEAGGKFPLGTYMAPFIFLAALRLLP